MTDANFAGFGVLHGPAVVPIEESPSKDIPYAMVDIEGMADGQATIECSFCPPMGTEVELMAYDHKAEAWRLHPCRVASAEAVEGLDVYSCGLEFVEDDGKVSDLRFLIECPLLECLPQQAFLRLINSLSRTSLQAGESLIEQGTDGRFLYIIQAGSLLVQTDTGGVILRMDKLGPGDVAGETAALLGEESAVSVVAGTDAVAWGLDREELARLTVEYPDLRVFLTELVTKHFESCPVTAERIIGKFVIRDLIGKGGWGLVYRGEHTTLHLPAAVKMLKHDMALEEVFAENFRSEATVIAGLSHPNIVNVYDIEDAYQTIFIAMELLEGQSLRDVLEKSGRLPHERTVNILRQVLSGLDYAHDKGVIHRDIKPDNIFLTAENHVKILDFGLACAAGTMDHSMAGTLQYAPPEQIDGEPVDGRADLYSLGIMAYEMTVGIRPYPEDDLVELLDLHCEEDIPDPAEAVPDIPDNLRRFIVKACKRDPMDRYNTAKAALDDLGREAAAKPRKARVVTLVYDEADHHAVDELLDEFGGKAADIGVRLQVMDINKI